MMRMKPPPFQWVACLQRMKELFIQNLKDRSSITMRLWADHCEYILAQRFRRGQQILAFYRRIWGEHALVQMFYGFRRQIRRNFKGFIFSSAGLCAFSWKDERITYDTVESHFDDVDFVKTLRKETLICANCKKRKAMGEPFEEMSYCTCLKSDDESIAGNSGWEPYIERKNMTIWRKEERPSRYAYKVYCVYDDITASDFLQVQIDLEYRKEWDDTAVVLDVVENDPADSTRSHVIYWEMRWPALFANRDYVFGRRYFINNQKNVIVICSKSTEHPKCPVQADKHRVNDYWSFMVVKPFKTIDDQGLEFVLTYYDDPGVSLPGYITNWVAEKQMPDFLNKLYLATKEFSYRRKYSENTGYSWEQFKVTEKGKYREQSTEVNTADSEDKQAESLPTSTAEENGSSSNSSESETNRTWWSYLYPNYFFA